jgi:hypothetical protein
MGKGCGEDEMTRPMTKMEADARIAWNIERGARIDAEKKLDDIEYHLAPAWVSVEERMPEKVGWYWAEIQFEVADVTRAMSIFFNPHHHEGAKFEFRLNNPYGKMSYKVLRYWDMPLPSPPTGGDE